MEKLYQIIKRPIISEKGSLQAEMQNAYLFEVSKDSSRLEVKQAVEKLFNVKVERVNTMIVHGGTKRTARSLIKRPNWKKAVVTLKEGQKIQFFQGV